MPELHSAIRPLPLLLEDGQHRQQCSMFNNVCLALQLSKHHSTLPSTHWNPHIINGCVISSAGLSLDNEGGTSAVRDAFIYVLAEFVR